MWPEVNQLNTSIEKISLIQCTKTTFDLDIINQEFDKFCFEIRLRIAFLLIE